MQASVLSSAGGFSSYPQGPGRPLPSVPLSLIGCPIRLLLTLKLLLTQSPGLDSLLTRLLVCDTQDVASPPTFPKTQEDPCALKYQNAGCNASASRFSLPPFQAQGQLRKLVVSRNVSGS